MGTGEHLNAGEDFSVTRPFGRTRRGYDPDQVDAHLASIAARLAELEAHSRSAPETTEDLVVRATKRSIDETLQNARDQAEGIVAAARAKADELEGGARRDYLDKGQLAEVRRNELEALDRQIASRKETLREITAQLRRVATALASRDRRAGKAPTTRRIAAMEDGSAEIVLPATPADDD